MCWYRVQRCRYWFIHLICPRMWCLSMLCLWWSRLFKLFCSRPSVMDCHISCHTLFTPTQPLTRYVHTPFRSYPTEISGYDHFMQLCGYNHIGIIQGGTVVLWYRGLTTMYPCLSFVNPLSWNIFLNRQSVKSYIVVFDLTSGGPHIGPMNFAI